MAEQPMEYVGDLTFEPNNVTPESTAEDWMMRARHEWGFSRLAAVYLNMDDNELAEHFKEYGKTDEEREDAIVDLAQRFQSWVERYEAGRDVMKAVVARLIVIGERRIGKERMDATYGDEEG